MVGGAQLGHGVQKQLQAVGVHAGDRLVEHQQVRSGVQAQRQQHPLDLAAGAAPQGPVHEVLRADLPQGGAHLLAGLAADAGPDRAAGEAGGHEVQHRQRHIPVELQVLRHIAGDQMRDVAAVLVDVPDGAAVGKLAQERAHQGGFSGAVLADEHGQLTAVDVHGHLLQKLLAAAGHGDVVQIDVAEVAGVGHGIPPVGALSAHRWCSRR